MNHESRIKQLEEDNKKKEERIKELEKRIELLEFDKKHGKWMPVKEVASMYGISPETIKLRIRKGVFEHLKDWKRNGNRYLINVNSIKKII